MTNPYLSVIIPAYNEAKRITKTLRDIDAYLNGRSYEYEIVVVNDGSKDSTAEVVGNLSPGIKNLRLIDNKQNKGKGGVVKDGMLAAKGEIRIFTDADNSTSLDQIEKMIPFFAQGYKVVIGSRGVKGAKLDPAQPLLKRIPGKLGNYFIQLLVLPGVKDTQCGFKAFTADAAHEVFKLSTITGWGFDIEILALAKNLGFKIKEIPVHWVNDLASHVKASAYLQVLIETIRIRLKLWKDDYGIRQKKKLKTI